MDIDIELMLKAKSGDDGAFSELMRRHYKAVVNYIYRYTNIKESSEDLAQEVFLRIYRSRKNYRPEAKFSTWLYKIATNVSLTHVKNKKVDRSLDEIDDEKGGIGDPEIDIADDLIYRKEIKEVIFQAMGTLPERERVAIMLCKYEGLSYEETAEVLECTAGAVKAYVHRGRIKLIEILKPYLPGGGEYGL